MRKKGKKFFSCRECDVFVWADKLTKTSSSSSSAHADIARWQPTPTQLTGVRRAGVHVHDDVTLLRSQQQQAWFVRLEGAWRASVASYSRDDVWVLAADASLSRAPVVVARASFHGAAKSGVMPVDVRTPPPADWAMRPTHCYALRAVNASSEFAALDNLESLDAARLPLLHTLLTGAAESSDGRVSVDVTRDVIDNIVADLVMSQRLNVDQVRVCGVFAYVYVHVLRARVCLCLCLCIVKVETLTLSHCVSARYVAAMLSLVPRERREHNERRARCAAVSWRVWQWQGALAITFLKKSLLTSMVDQVESAGGVRAHALARRRTGRREWRRCARAGRCFDKRRRRSHSPRIARRTIRRLLACWCARV
jgi:hypothetical protein